MDYRFHPDAATRIKLTDLQGPLSDPPGVYAVCIHPAWNRRHDCRQHHQSHQFLCASCQAGVIDHAAQVSGKNRTHFILDASCEKVQEVLADQTHFALSDQALQRFNELIEAPLTNTDALRRLLSTPAPLER